VFEQALPQACAAHLDADLGKDPFGFIQDRRYEVLGDDAQLRSHHSTPGDSVPAPGEDDERLQNAQPRQGPGLRNGEAQRRGALCSFSSSRRKYSGNII